MKDVLAIILAGGKGSRLEPLTRDRAKPAVPFGGNYRIIDFALSNCLNSGIRKSLVLTQYKTRSLDRHIDLAWRQYFCREVGEFIDIMPPQQRIDEQWYSGTADAVYQNIYALEQEHPKYIVILAGDHIYKMNYAKMVDYHKQMEADLTIAALPVSKEKAKEFGVMQVNEEDRIIGFEEKPPHPKTMPGDDSTCLASMGIYVFTTTFLFEQLLADANDMNSQHDFGKNVIPSIIGDRRVFAYPFTDENKKDTAYWRDVGTLDAYYAANMDLISVNPLLNMYDQSWPVRTYQPNLPPPKFVFDDQGVQARVGSAVDSIVCQGAIVSGGKCQHSILGPGVRINSYAQVSDSILFEGVNVGRNARIQRAIVDKGVSIPPNVEIGFDRDEDRRRGFSISPGGVVVIGKSDCIEPQADVKKPKMRTAAPDGSRVS